MAWQIRALGRTFPSVAEAKRYIERRYPKTAWRWTGLIHGPDGHLFCTGRGNETDDSFTIRQEK